MPEFSRNLAYQSPLARGPDVLAVQRALAALGTKSMEVDGLFGRQTEAAIQGFQNDHELPTTGIVDQDTWNALFQAPKISDGVRDLAALAALLKQPRQFRDSVSWRLGPDGIEVGGQPAIGTPGRPATVTKILTEFGDVIGEVCSQLGMPAELIVATIGVESSGNPNARRQEPGWTSDDTTPSRVSVGLMQTLISTARTAMQDNSIDAEWLQVPKNSIKAGAAYINSQFAVSGFDPPKVGCAYNAGGLYYDPSPTNRWRMRQYPIGTGTYADRLIAYFNDCFALLRENQNLPSFAKVYQS